MTIIKPKTKITLKTSSNNRVRRRQIRHRRTIYNLTSDICLLISVRHHISITSASGGSGNRLSRGLPFMQNEPNFQTNWQTLTLVMADTYNEKTLVNQKITNPIEPNTNPIAKRPKINANFCHNKDLQRKTNFAPKNNEPNRTQIQPNTNPKTNPISNFSCEILFKFFDF